MSTRLSGRGLAAAGFWALIAGLCVYYLYETIVYRFVTPGRLGPTLLDKQLWFWVHLVFALPVLIGAPLQFWTRLRSSRPHLHRAIGKAYVIGASIAALTAFYLGATIEYEGSRLPLVMLAAVWLFFTLAAWRRAKARDFAGHRLFMIRSYNLALVFIWLRLVQEIPRDTLFFYIADEGVRDTTIEWFIWVVPLLAMELYLAWIPQARGRRSA
jgi:uncharacterized membrane protein